MGRMENQKLAIKIAIQAQLTRGWDCPAIHLLGDSGCGKTAFSESYATSIKGSIFVDVSSTSLMPEYMGGIPTLDREAGVARMMPVSLFEPLLGAESGTGILLVDEFLDGSTPFRAACHKVITHKEIGDLKMPMKTAIIACSNPDDISTTGGTMSVPLVMRFCTIEFLDDLDDFRLNTATYGVNGHRWAEEESLVLPSDWEKHIPECVQLRNAFLAAKPDQYNSRASANEMFGSLMLGESAPQPSKRSWTYATNLLAACKSLNVSREVQRILVAGCVGETACDLFFTFISDANLPCSESLLRGERPTLPNRHDLLGVVMGGVVSAILDNNTVDRYTAGYAVAKWLDQSTGGVAQAVIAMSMIPMFQNIPAGMGSPPSDVQYFMDILVESGMLARRQNG